MHNFTDFYINGEWVKPEASTPLEVINPATEQVVGTISLGNTTDVNKAVQAAKDAFQDYSTSSVEFRLELLNTILANYNERMDTIAELISIEMGAPISFSQKAQAPCGAGHIFSTINALKDFKFEEKVGDNYIVKEAIGVCALITPWNWPINQVACKVLPALAAGCTMVLKPSEIAPFDAYIFAEILHASGVPKGVFNLVNGDGPGVGSALSAHPDVDMVSFTGSTRAGVIIAENAAKTVKRVSQELGGKSANIILEDADIESALISGISQCFQNTGQSCNAPTRLLIPKAKRDLAIGIAKKVAQKFAPGDPSKAETRIGPVSSRQQFDKIQSYIKAGIDEGATLVAGGLGKPDDLPTGYFVKPTVFIDVTNDMTIAKEEIFGPVLSILAYDNEEQAIEIANDTPYGLAGYVSSSSIEHAIAVAKKIRSGNIYVNGAGPDFNLPFGGYKQSGNGREWGALGIEEYLETKAILVD